MYKKYLKRLNTDFSVHDGVKCANATIMLPLAYIAWVMFGFTFIGSILLGILSVIFPNDPENNIPLVLFSLGVGGYVPIRLNSKNKKKWLALIAEYKKMQHQRCMELGLPIVIRKERVMTSSRTSVTQYYAAFLMPALFEEEFLKFRKSDTCRELVFDYKPELEWITRNMKECRIKVIDKAEVETYTFEGIKPIVLV